MELADAFGHLAAGFPTLEPGHVWLVGAGPGDPGLLTLHALSAIRQAEVIVHDSLIDARILALAGSRTRRELAGKRGGEPSTAQSDISRRLVELARDRQRVVRLKGGDPVHLRSRRRGGDDAGGGRYPVPGGVGCDGRAGGSRGRVDPDDAPRHQSGRDSRDRPWRRPARRPRLGGAGADRPAARPLYGHAESRSDRRSADAGRPRSANTCRRRHVGDDFRRAHSGVDDRPRRIGGRRCGLGAPAIVAIGAIVAAREQLLPLAAAPPSSSVE